MPSLKEIKTRIASVNSTRKITSAMKMVASSKLHHAQVAILYCGVHGLMHDVPMDKVRDCQDQFLDAMRSQHADVIETLADGKLTDDCIAVIKDTMANVAGQYKA